jgi:hypothetical protein
MVVGVQYGGADEVMPELTEVTVAKVDGVESVELVGEIELELREAKVPEFADVVMGLPDDCGMEWLEARLPTVEELLTEAEAIDATMVDRADEVLVRVVVNPIDEDVKVMKLPTRWISLRRIKRLGFLLTSSS